MNRRNVFILFLVFAGLTTLTLAFDHALTFHPSAAEEADSDAISATYTNADYIMLGKLAQTNLAMSQTAPDFYTASEYRKAYFSALDSQNKLFSNLFEHRKQLAEQRDRTRCNLFYLALVPGSLCTIFGLLLFITAPKRS